MTCPDCSRASTELWHGFSAACKGCQARAISRAPAYFEAAMAGRLSPAYRRLLEQFGLSHESVKEARSVDALGRLDSQDDLAIIPARPSHTRTA